MLIPSIDLMGGRIVQLVQGEKLKLAFCTVVVPVIFERSSAVSTWFGANAIRT